MTVMNLTPDHADMMAAIHALSFDHPWPVLDLNHHIETDIVLGACDPENSQTLKGFIITRHVHEQVEILTLAVHPNYRKEGVGHALLRAAEATVQDQGAKAMFLEVAEDNAPAIALYQKAGYIAFHRRPDYYKRQHGRVAALNLSKNLGPMA